MPKGDAMKSNESDNSKSNLGSGMLIPGEPGAVKVARPVRRGEWRNVPTTSGEGEHRTAQRRIGSFPGQATRPAPALPHNKILTVPQAAEHLQVSERTIYSWLRDRKIPGRKIGKVWRISEDAIVDFLREGQDGGHISYPLNGTLEGRQTSTAAHTQSSTENR
jgi:excisionase family DNA binding protein